jgi:phosphoserine phosphatase
MSQKILVTVSGMDKPGITSSLMGCLVKDDCQVLDIGQNVTHGFLSLSFLIDTKSQKGLDAPILKDLLFEAKKLGVDLDFDLIEDPISKSKVIEKHILSCVSSTQIMANFIDEVSTLLATSHINIHRIENVSDTGFKSLDIAATTTQQTNWLDIKKELIKISDKHQVDMAFLKDDVFRWNKRLIVFDMDSTLIQMEVIDEMAKVWGVGNKVSEITEKAMNGEYDFTQSLKERVKLLKDMPEEKLHDILKKIKVTEGVEEFINTVKPLGYKTAVISGGFSFFANALKDKLGLDYAFANELEIKNGLLTGDVTGTIVDANQKAILLELIAQQEKISPKQVVAIGDGANDLPMLSKAGLGIAYHAKDVVKESADHQMSHGPMDSILYFLGIPGKNVEV